MPIYEYECEFGHKLEESQSIKEYKPGQTRQCSECGNVMERVIGEPICISVDNGPTTVGQLGERNFKALGKIKGEEMLAENKRKKEEGEKELLRMKGIDADRLPDYKHLRKLSTLTPQQKQRYIETGKLPPAKRRNNKL